jgi:hypothetical protein
MMMGLVVSCGMILGLVKPASIFWMAIMSIRQKWVRGVGKRNRNIYCCTIYIMINGFHVANFIYLDIDGYAAVHREHVCVYMCNW